MKKVFKKIGLICGTMLLTMSTIMATPIQATTSSNNIAKDNSNTLLLFVPEDTTTEELLTIHNSNTEEFPNKEIIIIKESIDMKWADEDYQKISLKSDNLKTSDLNVEDKKVKVADAISVEEIINEKQLSVEGKSICIIHNWNETLVGSPYKRYSKNINGWCYKMYQDIVRICKACDKTQELQQEITKHNHNWEYRDNLGNQYNYKCTQCGMAKK